MAFEETHVGFFLTPWPGLHISSQAGKRIDNQLHLKMEGAEKELTFTIIRSVIYQILGELLLFSLFQPSLTNLASEKVLSPHFIIFSTDEKTGLERRLNDLPEAV